MEKTRILIADSSTFMRIILNNAMEQLGFEVVALAKNGEEAVDQFTQQCPDITLVDMALEKPDGIAVINALTERNPTAAVVLMIPENMDDPELIVAGIRAGATAYIKKPLSGEELKRRLSNIVKRRSERLNHTSFQENHTQRQLPV